MFLTSECCARCGSWAGEIHVFCRGCVIEGAEFKYLLEVS